MNLDDMAHMADQERKREREEGIGPKAMVSITFDKWREVNAELEQLRRRTDTIAGLERDCRREQVLREDAQINLGVIAERGQPVFGNEQLRLGAGAFPENMNEHEHELLRKLREMKGGE